MTNEEKIKELRMRQSLTLFMSVAWYDLQYRIELLERQQITINQSPYTK